MTINRTINCQIGVTDFPYSQIFAVHRLVRSVKCLPVGILLVCVAVLKTGSAGLIAYRLMSRDSEWVWLQTSARVVYKNSKPEYIIAVHRHLTYVLDHCTELIGATENAGVENAIRAKLQGWEMQEWKKQE